LANDGRGGAGRGGQIEQAVGGGGQGQRVQGFRQSPVSVRFGEVALQIMQPRGEARPLLGEVSQVAGLGRFRDAALQTFAEGIVGQHLATDSQDLKLLGQAALAGQTKQRRYQLAPRQVAGGAENDDDAWLGCGQGRGRRCQGSARIVLWRHRSQRRHRFFLAKASERGVEGRRSKGWRVKSPARY